MLHGRLQGRSEAKALLVMSCNLQKKFVNVKWKTLCPRAPFPSHSHRQQPPFRDSPSISKSNLISPPQLTKKKETLLYKCFGFRDGSVPIKGKEERVDRRENTD